MNEPNQENPSLSEGARRLSLIGRPDLIGAQVTLTDGRVVSSEYISCGANADRVIKRHRSCSGNIRCSFWFNHRKTGIGRALKCPSLTPRLLPTWLKT
jgi:hypothetical protein